MFRQGIRRCAGLAGSSISTCLLRRSHAALPVATAISRRNAPLAFKTAATIVRSYSSEAYAEDSQKDAQALDSESTAFADLAPLGLDPNLLKAIIKDMQYATMTPVQAKTITPALKGTDIVAQAKTGTGKTLAFLLPLLQRMIRDDPTLAGRSASYRARSDDIRGIILSPTRELALQIAEEAARVTRRTGIVVQSAVGGTQKSAMLRKVQREGCHLLVATPGRLNDLLTDQHSGIAAPRLAAFVLDEADRMLDVGFDKEIDSILACLPNPEKKVRQTMLVSATIPDNVIRLARSMIRATDFEFVQTIPENESLTHERVPQYIVPLASWANVFPALFELADKEAKKAEEQGLPPFKAIVYFNTTALTELAGRLGFERRKSGNMRVATYCIHSKLTQQGRSKASDAFRRIKSGILFSSDVTARGMDFPDVTHVIQVDTPRDRASYIHRLGRTARQGKMGEGWMFMPRLSLSGSRSTLANLPLQENKIVESAAADVESQEGLTPYHQEVKDLMGPLHRDFDAMYTSMFGFTVADKHQLVDDLNLWATKGLGLAQPPCVSADWVNKMGLRHSNLNIGPPRRHGDADRIDGRRDFNRGGRDFGRDSRDFDRGSRGDGSSFGRRGSNDRPSDPFSQMRGQVRRDGGFENRRGSFNRDSQNKRW
ncbi:hypothetical protein HIM_00608 [Hirsutella minnesotensis 3608]|nr:hypothetical protein HIM_00608 [Hirsutella minnesotensis 3608]